MHQLLPLFPLNTVLFPDEVMSLHIFEERYKQMIGRCLERQEPFGVALIETGPEVGGVAQPYQVGTSATVVQALRFEDGRMLVAIQGGQRFRIEEIVEETPYLVGAVEFLEDEVDSERQAQADFVRGLYDRYRSAAPIVTSVAQPLEELPLDPIALSYRLSDQLHVTCTSKQQLLEADLETRLEALADALEEELRLLPPQSSPPKQHPDGPWSLN